LGIPTLLVGFLDLVFPNLSRAASSSAFRDQQFSF